MSNPEWSRDLLGLGLGLGLSLCLLPAQACGPDFPLRLLDNRAQTLAELPENNFAFEVSRLGTAIAGLKSAQHGPQDEWQEGILEGVERREQVEQQELSAPQLQRVRALRALTDPEQAYREGADLPAELRLYSAGAVAFAQAQDELAISYFQQLLALPAAERPLRSTWAAYSLGRLEAARSLPDGLPAGAADNEAEAAAFARNAAARARAAFQQVRQLVIEGFNDPLELAIASLGEEARIDKDQGDWATAIGLYASQYRQGDLGGYTSLRFLARELSTLPEAELVPLLRELPVQQLVTAYLISRADWAYDEQPAGQPQLIALLQRNDIANLANADRLAALSYQTGRYENAATLLEHAGDTGLAWWLRAKLALRRGDKAAASLAYAKAAQVFPTDEHWGPRRDANWNFEYVTPRCRVDGERALLALERGDYLEAFAQLYASGDIYWQDSAVVAERVLTLDELKGYVDQHVVAPPPAVESEGEGHFYNPRPVAARLRQLLGRRLLRAERYAEAVAYFDGPQAQQRASEYGQQRMAGRERWRAIDRAQALYAAAAIARRHGMELLGYEMSPDHASTDGNYEIEWADRQTAAPWLSAAEATRQNAHLAQPNKRYHYRYVAADLANQAADLLPERSQAFAATLCKAGSWLIERDLPSARIYYNRWTSQGAWLPWMVNFGRGCEEPDFDLARERLWQYRETAVRQALAPYSRPLWGAFGVSLVLLGGLYWRARRQGKST
ncbi:MAG: hypothetical protein ABWY06_11370 [Pseudomonas sp.]|uniref:hypothetical protein n=1 Tax=Pseudomonas sp. TaxID=306 RepID=UPI003391E41D